MNIFETIRGRRSIRKYQKNDVKIEDLKKAIEYAALAPSAGNIQPWEFVIVRDTNIKEKLYRASFYQRHVMDAPVLIVVCADLMRAAYYGTRGTNLYAIQDTAAAIENMLLSLYAMGYGTCWVGAFSEHAVREALKIPGDLRPVAIITVGKADEKPPPRELRKIDEIVHFDHF